MKMSEEQRAEETAAIERERRAFDRHQVAWRAVLQQFIPHGTGDPTAESMEEFEAAEREWREAISETNRIAEEIRTGKRR